MAKKKTKKTKPAPVEELEDDEDFEPSPKGKRRADEDDDEDPMKPRARYDVYFGLTLLTTLILIGASVLLYLDQEDLKSPANSGFNPPSVTAGALAVGSTPKQN